MSLGGVQVYGNDTIDIMNIGEDDSALVCQTDLRPCCRTGFRAGEWFYPNGSVVHTEGTGGNFYRNRGDDGTVKLNRRNNASHPIGIYRCEVPNENNISQTLYIGVFNSGHFGRLF